MQLDNRCKKLRSVESLNAAGLSLLARTANRTWGQMLQC